MVWYTSNSKKSLLIHDHTYTQAIPLSRRHEAQARALTESWMLPRIYYMFNGSLNATTIS